MNAQLVDTLAQIIKSLTPEEKTLLEEKIKNNRLEEYQKLVELREKILARRGGKPLELPVDEIIHQMREERTEQLMQACFPELYPSESQGEG